MEILIVEDDRRLTLDLEVPEHVVQVRGSEPALRRLVSDAFDLIAPAPSRDARSRKSPW